MRPVPDYYQQRRMSWLRGLRLAGIVVIAFVASVGGLWAAGLLDLSRFGPPTRSTAGLVPVPAATRNIPAFAKVTRDYVVNPTTQQLNFIYLPPRSVTPEMLTELSDILGRVVDHEKPANFVFTEADFLPKGTREGLVGGIPAGKRAVRVEAERVDGLYGLHVGDRFDLVSSLALDTRIGQNAFAATGSYAPQLSLQAGLTNWQKQATVHVIVQNGMVVEPMTTRQVPVFARTLTQGGITRMRPVQEAVLAVDPDEVARLTEAMAVEAKISVVPRSGRPDDPEDSITPDLRPMNPFTNATATGVGTASSGPFSMVERINGSKRELTAVPRR
jgi:Flp pilus assembly protein CpaB